MDSAHGHRGILGHRTSLSRRAVIGSGLGLAVSFATGCLSSTAEQDEPTKRRSGPIKGEIEWWTINLKKNYGAHMQGLIDAFQKQHSGVTIKWVDVPGQDITQKFLAAVASGDLPDAVNVASPALGAYQPALSNLDDFFSKDELADFQPNLLNPLRINGQLAAVPWYNGGSPVSTYRKSVMSKAGFQLSAAPTSWDQALDLAQRVRDTTGVYGTNTMPQWFVLRYYGIDLVTGDRKKAAFNAQAAVDVLQRFKTAYDKGGLAPGSIDKNTRNLPQNIDNAQIGFLPFGNGANLVITRKNAPEVYADLDIASSVKTKDGKYLLIGQQTYGIPARAKNKDGAAAWIKFLTNAANQLGFCRLAPLYPSSITALKDDFFQKVTGNTPYDAARKVIVSTLPDLVSGAIGTSKDEEIGEAFDEQVRGFLSGNATAKEALSNAEKKWNTILATAE